jgi:branched-subunit amino acid ABC-type transport system permease component
VAEGVDMSRVISISIELALNSLVLSGVFLIVALGLNIIYGLSRVVNLSHASLYTLGAYFGDTLVHLGVNFYLVLIFAPLLVGMVGLIIEQTTISPMRKRPLYYSVILTYGLMFFLDGLIKYFWGTGIYFIKLPAFLEQSLSFFGIHYPVFRLVILIIVAVVLVCVMLLLGKTKMGMAMRAASHIPEMVSCLGINIRIVHIGAFVLGSLLGGIAGVLAGPLFTIHLVMGREMLIMAFVVIVIGGLGSLRGSAIAALLIGTVQSVAEFFIADLAMVIIYIMMAIVLVFEPRGLLGEGRFE